MSHAGPRILVVDDNEDNRYTLTRRLQREGYTTGDGRRTAARRWSGSPSEPFDLVLLDIMMPEMNGYEVLERLKADRLRATSR